MIPISLTLKGLYSYQREQTINFDRLLEGQLFGIFGAVGSGKSSILEAISFALYGQTERMNSQDNRNYNMMNLKSNELLIDFSFSNHEQINYRFTVKGKRHGKDFEKVNTFVRSAYQMIDGQWIPLESANAEQVIGLSYDNFRRTIIIPQGKFQEFLQLTYSQRTQMLKEIFQLEKFEFFYQTRNLESKNNSEMQHISGKLSTYVEITQEKIDEKKNKINLFKKQLTDKQKIYEKKKTVHAALSSLKELLLSKSKQEEVLSKLKEKKDFYQELESKIKNIEYCLQHFKQDLQLQEISKANFFSLEKQLEVESKNKDVLENTLKGITSELEKVEPEFRKQDYYKEKLNDFEVLIDLLKLSEEIKSAEARIFKGEEVVKDTKTSKDEFEKKKLTLKNEIAATNKQMPNVSELVELRTWFDKKAQLEADVKTQGALKTEIENEKKKLDESFLEQLSAFEFFTFEDGALNLNKLTNQLLKQFERENHSVAELNDKIEHYKLQLKLEEYTDALKRGDACPLCGSVDHVSVLEIADVNKQLRVEEEVLLTKKKKLEGFQELQNSFKFHEKEVVSYSKKLSESQLKLNESKEKLVNHRNQFIWEKYNSDYPNEVLEQLKSVELIQKKMEELNTSNALNEEALEKINAAYTRYVEKVAELKQESGSKKAEYAVFIKQLKHHSEVVLSDLALVNLNEQYLELRDKIQRDKSLYENLIKEITTTKEELFKSKTRLETFESQLITEKARLNALEKSLEEKLENSKFSDWKTVHEYISSTLELDKEKENLQRYNLELYSEEAKLAELNLQAHGKVFEEEHFASLSEEMLKNEKEIVTLNEEYIGENSLLNTWLTQFSEKELLQKKLENLEIRAENIQTMRQLFTANGFVNYISTVYLQNLCQIANERFYQLTRQQLQLELGDKNEFLVRDFMNDGKLRSVKTLSGGQTFQASLCLALALAESVQQLNKSKQNFFFLDEGFGSLDKESLEMAFETLKSLRKENRMVGIISHVEELQQEIEVYLKVVNDSLTGSEITKSWE